MDDATQIDGPTAQDLRGRSLCPKCGIRPRRSANGTRGYCRECDREWYRAHADRKKFSSTRCTACHQTVPHKGGKCPVAQRRAFVARGRRQIEARWPGYAQLLTDEDLLARAGHSWPHVTGFPLPSRLFRGLDAGLDQRLIREQRDKDVPFCQALAAVPSGEQREFLELYLVDPSDAKHWAALPRWKRPIRKGDPDDVLVWKFFTMHRLNMEQAAANVPPWSMASQGAQLPQLFGTLMRLSLPGVQKLGLVMNAFGDALQYGRELGNVSKKPWEEGR
jgi:hypothetical protein